MHVLHPITCSMQIIRVVDFFVHRLLIQPNKHATPSVDVDLTLQRCVDVDMALFHETVRLSRSTRCHPKYVKLLMWTILQFL